MAQLEVSLQGRQYHYRSTRFFEERGAGSNRVFHLDEDGRVGGLKPEVLELLAAPALGCRDVLEETSQTAERLCVDSVGQGGASGRLGQRSFTAQYGPDGALEVLVLPFARWEAVAGAGYGGRKAENPFAKGFAVRGVGGGKGAPRLEPDLAGSHHLEVQPRGVGQKEKVGRVRCLVAAREFVAKAQAQAAEVVLGLVVEDGRAFPHAWAKRGAVHLDPSVLAGERRGPRREYLVLPTAVAGQVYLELLAGTRSVHLAPAGIK